MNQLTVIGLGAADFEQMQMGFYKKIKMEHMNMFLLPEPAVEE